MSFDVSFLDDVAHRPWPLPSRPWVMKQSWLDLLFAHWPIDRAAVAALVPREFEIDVFDGSAWIGVVPFEMRNVAPRGVPPLPWISAFPELNVRTYVRAGKKPGVVLLQPGRGEPVGRARREAMASASVLLRVDGDRARGGRPRDLPEPPQER